MIRTRGGPYGYFERVCVFLQVLGYVAEDGGAGMFIVPNVKFVTCNSFQLVSAAYGRLSHWEEDIYAVV